MLKINQLDKKFNKGKRNQIHAINNTSLEMEDKGLVALLGPSGCGKTTLLNAIGGLDKPDRGSISINGQRITRRRSGKIDSIRTLNIGYIFQNYNLVDSMTVFENVAVALRMTGVRKERDIEDKVNYVLKKTGMFRYRNRTAAMLSGGERQRVGIARAIVKNPAIIIADEPTGNLDSKNTIEVMNIIKTISKEKLVILVTHEEELAQFYATRIIRISDGRIVSDLTNDGADGLDYRIDNKIYLKDIKEHKRLSTDKYLVNFYNDSQGKLSLDIVVRDGSVLIRNNIPETRLEFVDDDSAVEFIDDHYRKMEEGDEASANFDLEKLKTSDKRKYRSIIGPVKMIRLGFSNVRDYGLIKKILLVGFVVSAMFTTYAISNAFGTLNLTDDMFVKMDRSYLTVTSKKNDVDDYANCENNPDVAYVMPGDSLVSLRLKYDTYLQTSDAYVMLDGSLSDVDKVSEADLIYGRMPEKSNEIIVDKLAIKNTITSYSTKEIGLGKVRNFLNCKVEIENMNNFKIVGITDFQSPCIYTQRSQFINIIANSDTDNEYDAGLLDYELKTDKFTKVKGSWPENPYEVMVNEMNKEEMKIGKTIKKKVNGQKLKVVGYYKDARDSDILVVSNETIKYQLIRSMPGMTISAMDKNAVMSQLRENNINVKDSYKQSKKEYIKQNRAYNKASLIAAIVILAISCIEIFIIMRASFMSRVKEVGVFRAIGVKKNDIYKMFVGEIIAITILTSLPGFVAMYYILYKLVNFSYFESTFMVTPAVGGICLAVICGVNLFFGLIPVKRTMRKRPAEILARTDIN